jgi:hypothetical protein
MLDVLAVANGYEQAQALQVDIPHGVSSIDSGIPNRNLYASDISLVVECGTSKM